MPKADTKMDENITILRRSDLFSQLSSEDLSYIASKTSELSTPIGTGLFDSGDKAARFYIIKSGSVRVFRNREDGVQEDMALFTSGDTLGDFDFARGAVFDAAAESAEDSVLLVFPGPDWDFSDLLREKPGIGARVKLRSLAMLAGRLRSTNQLISRNAPWVRELQRRAYEDPGTGLWSKTFLDEEVSRAPENPCAMVVLKPDRFKLLVDARGHSAGDVAMNSIAGVLKSLVREYGRGWGIRIKSNETAIVVPGLKPKEAQELAERVGTGIAKIPQVPAEGDFPAFAFSASVAWAVWPNDGEAFSELFKRCHADMLEIWGNGGARVGKIRTQA